MDLIEIVEMSDEHVDGFHRCVGIVARQRKYLAFLDAPPIAATRAFVRSIADGGGAQFIAIDPAAGCHSERSRAAAEARNDTRCGGDATLTMESGMFLSARSRGQPCP